MTDENPIDMNAARAELLARFPPSDYARKLSLAGQCAIYACLHQGVPPYVLAESYGLSRATLSQIGGCRDDERRPVTLDVGGFTETLHTDNLTRRRNANRKPRYQAVAREFDRLGETEFLRLYFTPAVMAKVGRVKPRSRAYDPTDTDHNGLCHDGEGYVTINLIEGQGWAYFDCDENGENLSGPYLNDEQKYFRTDRAAWEHLNAASKNNLKAVDKD